MIEDPFSRAMALNNQEAQKKIECDKRKKKAIDELLAILHEDRSKLSSLGIKFIRSEVKLGDSDPVILLTRDVKGGGVQYNIITYHHWFEAEGRHEEEWKWDASRRQWDGKTFATKLGDNPIEAATTIARCALSGELPQRSCATDGYLIKHTPQYFEAAEKIKAKEWRSDLLGKLFLFALFLIACIIFFNGPPSQR